MKLPLTLALAMASAVLGHNSVMAADIDAQCQSLLQDAPLSVVMKDAKFIPAGPAGDDPNRMMTGASGRGAELPAQCRVRGEINPRTGADGKHYGIQFELRLPQQWQNRMLFQGGGGLDGFLANAIGSIPTLGLTAAPALARGYAVVSMDGGHPNMDPSFANDQQARIDYAYAAIGKVTAQAKRLIQRYYSAAPEHSYFMGCSNGGCEAMIAAQSYPTEFDGVVVGNPGFHLSRAAVGEAWDTKTFTDIAPRNSEGKPILSQAFTPADLKLVSDAVLERCDDLDGIKDGIINNYQACHFYPVGQSGQSENCLSGKQVSALHKVFSGAKNSKGEALYSSWPYDAGISADGWRSWKLGTSTDADHPNASNATLGAGHLKATL